MTYKLPIPERSMNKASSSTGSPNISSSNKPQTDEVPLTKKVSLEDELNSLRLKLSDLESVKAERDKISEQLQASNERCENLQQKLDKIEQEQNAVQTLKSQFEESLIQINEIISRLQHLEQNLQTESESFIVTLSLKLMEDLQGALSEKSLLKNTLAKKFSINIDKIDSAIKVSKEISESITDMEQSEIADYLKGFTIEVNQNELVTLVDYDGYFKQLRELING
ncbi:MAG: hypothetical protein HWE27_17765 [Gammaproteobacteria bacterium]|nr:hypothetical protein [Gammaproteobacteria bacterium]